MRGCLKSCGDRPQPQRAEARLCHGLGRAIAEHLESCGFLLEF
jgi:hypothetical protein